MEELWQRVKDHPWITGAIVVAVFILVYMLVGGSSSGAASSGGSNNNYAAEVAAATQLQEAQLAAQSQGNQANVALQAQMGQYQAATTIAQIQAQTDQANIAAQQAVATQQLQSSQEVADRQAQSQDLQTSTYGQIAANYLTTQQNMASINTTAAQNIYSEYFNNASQMQQATLQAQIYNNIPQAASTFAAIESQFGSGVAENAYQATNPWEYFANSWGANYYGNNPSTGSPFGSYPQTQGYVSGQTPTASFTPFPTNATPHLSPLPYGNFSQGQQTGGIQVTN